MSKQFSF